MQPRTTAQHRTYVGLLFNWFDNLVLMGGGTEEFRVELKITVIYCFFDAGSAEAWVRSLANACEMSGGHNCIGTSFCSKYFSFRQSVSFHQSYMLIPYSSAIDAKQL
jgi:hypothetical protein